MVVENTLALYDMATITAVKSSLPERIKLVFPQKSYKARVFSTATHFHPILLYAGKAWSLP
jgi:hypothetical protein